MLRTLLLLVVTSVAAPALASEGKDSLEQEQLERIVVRPGSPVYVNPFANKVKNRQANRRARLQAMKKQQKTAAVASAESALFSRVIRQPVDTDSQVASTE